MREEFETYEDLTAFLDVDVKEVLYDRVRIIANGAGWGHLHANKFTLEPRAAFTHLSIEKDPLQDARYVVTDIEEDDEIPEHE